MVKSLESAKDLLEIFPNEDDSWVRAQIIRMMDSISSSLAEGRQRLTNLEEEVRADNALLSLQIAHELQDLEVRSHLQWIGRLDMPRDQASQRPRQLTLRSINVPSPIRAPRELPSTSSGRQRTIDEYLIRPGLNTAIIETPTAKLDDEKEEAEPDTAEEAVVPIAEPVEESESDDDEKVEHFSRCVHHRLHRIFSPRDLTKMKKMLKKSCAKTCGKKMISLRRMTLYKPLPQKLKANLDSQFVTCEKESRCETRSQAEGQQQSQRQRGQQHHHGELVELPTIHLPQAGGQQSQGNELGERVAQLPQLSVAVSQAEREIAERALSDLLHNSTIEIVTLDSSTDSVQQLDGLLDTEAILNLEDNVDNLRQCTPWDGDLIGPFLPVPTCPTPLLGPAVPRTTGRTPDLNSPMSRYLDMSYFGQITVCSCEDFHAQGFCECSPRKPPTGSQ